VLPSLGRRGVVQSAEPELLDEPLLERRVGALDAARRGGRGGAEAVDVERLPGAAELRDPRAPLRRIAFGDVADAQPIAGEGHRLPVALEVAPRGPKVVERRLDLGEGELHEPACGIVDVDQQGAHRAAVLEPGMLGAVDLDELAETRTARPRRLAAPQALRTRDPEARRRHPPAHGLHGAGELVLLGELLMRKGWPEVAVPFPDERHGLIPYRLRQPTIARPTAPPRRQRRRAGTPGTAAGPDAR
jgi:hypothetical protein